MKFYKKIFFSVLALSLILHSCDLEESNIDPSRPLNVELSLILPTAIGQSAFNQMALPARQPGIIVQHFAGIDAQQLGYSENYLFEENTFNNYWNGGAYGGVLKDARDLIQQGTEEGQPYYVGIGKVLMAEEFGRLTSSFGDIPFSDALKGTESIKPVFDKQEDVYDGVLRILDEAIIELSKPAVAGGPASDDLLFGGNASKWIKLAHGLKARYLMHLTKRRSVYAQVLTEVSASFVSQAEEPVFQWQSAITAANPLAKFGLERSNTLKIDSRFGEALTNRVDPRRSRYFDLQGSQYDFHNSNNTKLIWAQNNSAIPFLSFAELKLYEAEARLMTSDEPGAQTALSAAVDASMAQIGVGASEAAEVTAYKATYANLALAATQQDKLRVIIGEAYYTLYAHQEQTVWTNYRRTGYPALTPPATGTSGLNPSGVVPRRWVYPGGEKTTNSVNVNAAIANQGGELLDKNTWAFDN
ncbi:SusD/RagB family nutrient-binding outer membrane lipoprotein [uncultured Roseivirga sp.]|uniref:SusD/RagB family nutrient-binding outer membrane lipoprotein n=1 Tax=uncultured Roseivirga sp. TaxID=543088 RepID=UPI0030DAD34F|tara:strand:- start:66160 stop:67575 length:1416 start_codon:yes stop_codon:yes gene_type:complete